MKPNPVFGAQSPFWRGLALAACPRHSRPWLEALFGELAVIEGAGPRLVWLLGAANFIAKANSDRAVVSVSNHLHLAIALAFGATAISGVLFRTGSEGLGLDDDIFIGLASVFGAVFIALSLRALSRHEDSLRPRA